MSLAATFHLRQMTMTDLPQVLQIQTEAYGTSMIESAATLAAKHRLSPHTCWVAVDNAAQVAGYIFSHPWEIAAPPALNVPIDALPEAADCWYIHDLALAARTRGAGVAARLYATAYDAARSLALTSSALVAVQASQPFWAKLGYAPAAELSPKIRAKLAGYGGDAVFMTRQLTASPVPMR